MSYKSIINIHQDTGDEQNTNQNDKKENRELPPPIDFKDYRVSQRTNYLPHKKPLFTNREKWHYHYLDELIDIYNIIKDIINREFPHNKIMWNQQKFNNLSRLVYHCSSKYLV